ncbi:hypothetical protein [Kitasatospora phosalacinea]|uniref:hypothetical protein n=1 Tax=Kitasatospora phosalacinea TaxID=2065 RepID=UPI00052728BC|nr:hypothetical protein [Kitasatospora phosalacinea]
MLITVSTALLFGAITAALVWFKRVSGGTALAVWLSGFTAASTGLSGPVNDIIASLVTAVSNH